MSMATITSKGQITLPKDVRDELRLKEGDRVSFEKVDGRFVLRPQNRTVMDLAGVLHRAGEGAMTVREMDQALGDALAEDDKRIRDYGAPRARRR
jgi:AbrB family looped-hinge helix DNA binding protein